VGKSRLARRLTTIMPTMSLAEALETTRIHRVAGLTGDRTALVTTRPFRAPHHTISDVGQIGGGHLLMPGEVSLAHNCVLFLEARAACRRHVLSAASSTTAQFLLEDTTAPTPCCSRRGMKC
jgi:magnesium chelatase family protein